MLNDINRLRQQSLMNNYGLTMGGRMPSIQYQQQQPQYDPTQDPYFDEGPQQPPPAAPPISSKSTVSTSPKSQYEPTSSGIEELVGMTNRIYTPETKERDRYSSLLDNAPEMNNPGLLRALVAGGLAFGSNAKGKEMLDMQGAYMYAPFLRDKAEFETKTKPFYDAASLEQTANSNERTLAGNLATNYTNMEKNRMANEQLAEKNAEIARNNDLKYELGRQKNEILFAEKNGTEFNFDGESVLAYRKDGTMWDTGVPTTAFSPYELEERRQRGRMAVQASRNQNALDVQDARNAGALDVQDARNEGALGVQESRNTGAANVAGIRAAGAASPYDPKDEEGRLQQFLQRKFQTDPGAKDAIQFRNGVYSMKPKPPARTGTILSGPVNDNSAAVANWERINREVFGEAGGNTAPYTPTPIGGGTRTTPVTSQGKFNTGSTPQMGAPNTEAFKQQHQQDVEQGISYYVMDVKTGQIVGSVKKDNAAAIQSIETSNTHKVVR